jgi:hypothetical protein
LFVLKLSIGNLQISDFELDMALLVIRPELFGLTLSPEGRLEKLEL